MSDRETMLAGDTPEAPRKRHTKGAPTNKLIVLSLLVVVMLSGGGVPAPAQAQTPGVDAKPTFYRLTPGVYGKGWPHLSVSCPKECGTAASLTINSKRNEKRGWR